MDEKQIRLECLRMARNDASGAEAVKLAQTYYEFVVGSQGKTPPPGITKVAP